MPDFIEVLLIEDDDVEAQRITEMLDTARDFPTRLSRAENLTQGIEWLRAGNRNDIVLLGLSLPESCGLPTLDRLCADVSERAIVVLTSVDNGEMGSAAVQRGAQDCLIKGKVDAELLVRSIAYAIERHRLRSQMARLLVELERSNHELEQFAYVVAHDLKAPLRTISGFCQLLGRSDAGHFSDEENEFLSYIVDGGQRMKAIIDDLLKYSRVHLGEDQAEPTELSTVLDRSIANLQASIEQSGALITRDPLPILLVNGPQIGQLFQNLIGNAIKFRGDEVPRVHVSSQESGHEWRFSVRDNGIGIEASQRDRVFQVFQRLHGEGEYEGTGIGLAICKKVVEVHGGQIRIESEPGKGSEFCFTIPKQPPAQNQN
ncbi:MAG: response regulator [Planctomycetes bacterium]|nr:response regulator [Planctomycetota bacterium]